MLLKILDKFIYIITCNLAKMEVESRICTGTKLVSSECFANFFMLNCYYVAFYCHVVGILLCFLFVFILMVMDLLFGGFQIHRN